MNPRRTMILMAVLVVPVLAAGREPGVGTKTGREDPAARCVVATAQGEFASALEPCREAAEGGALDVHVLEAAARAELEAGDPARSEAIWRRLIDAHGWQWPWAQGLARSLWRQERTAEAEAVLRDAVERDSSPGPARELVAFLMEFSRWDDAAEAARAALRRFPGDCTLHESLGVAEAGLGEDTRAARAIRKALELGCPPLRWTKRGEIPHRIDRPEYRKLLDPRTLVAGLDALPEGEALHRLRLLELVPDPAVAPEVADAILRSRSAPVKLLGLHILQGFGKAAAPQWEAILSAPDLMLRKHALRMIVRTDEPFLVPILERRLDEEKAPHNLGLVRIALARRIAETDPGRARKLLEAIGEDDPSLPLAKEVLARISGSPDAGGKETVRPGTITGPLTAVPRADSPHGSTGGGS